MPLTNVEIQARYRFRQKAAFEARTKALGLILAELEGNDKPLAVRLRAIAAEGLA